MSGFNKKQTSLRYWLQGAGFFKALEAMEFARKYHIGTRKDGITPEFDHQVSIAQYIRTLHHGITDFESTMATIFLHDVREDYGISFEETDTRFGVVVANSVEAMTKEFRGVKKPIQSVFEDIGNDPCASIAKGADRIHNFSSMVGVFSLSKQKEYIQEGKDYFLPMLKIARRKFPQQEPVYENIKTMLVSQMTLIEAIHNASV